MLPKKQYLTSSGSDYCFEKEEARCIGPEPVLNRIKVELTPQVSKKCWVSVLQAVTAVISVSSSDDKMS